MVHTHFTTSLEMQVPAATYLHPQLRQIIFETSKKHPLLLGRYECRWPPSWLRSSEKVLESVFQHTVRCGTPQAQILEPQRPAKASLSEAIHCPKLPRMKRTWLQGNGIGKCIFFQTCLSFGVSMSDFRGE